MGDAKNINMGMNVLKNLLKKTVDLGATKVTFLGGEPTLHPLLPDFIGIAKNLGFGYIRLDTNGEFDPNLLENLEFKKLDNICFSLDGVDPKTHAKIRTVKNYYSVINNIKKAVSLGYDVRVTMTINSFNLSQIEKMASALEKMGVSALNIHLTSENGRAKINESLLVDEEKWINCYKKIFPRLAKYNIKIKLPKRYIKKSECQNYGITCESVKSSRVLITPDLKIYSCPLLLDSDRYFAYFKKDKFYYTKNYKENLFEYGKIKGPLCPLLIKNNSKKYKEKQIIPVCVSDKQSNRVVAVKYGE
jgi:MoaA/NifB/PqqE/SkfB family radical SAM enzyme